MRFLTAAEMEHYIESGDWIGKAGGYGIQDRDPFVTRIAGSHTNIVGLPMNVAKRVLAEAGVKPEKPPPPSPNANPNESGGPN